MSTTNITLTDRIRQTQRTRSTPCVLIAKPEAVIEQIFLSDLENASNRAASFLESELPKNDGKFFYMGPSDVRYFIWVLAAMKTGRCVIFPSPGNTVPSNQRLFKTVGAKTMLYAPEAQLMLVSLVETTRGEVRSIATPCYSELMSREPAPISVTLDKSFEEVKDVAVMGLHTSGTSGHPKPIYWTHGSIAALATHSDSSGVYPQRLKADGLTSLLQDVFSPGEVVLMPFPLYHMGGISPVFFSILYGNTHVMPATSTQMTSENITRMLRCSKSTTAWLAPSLLEEMLNYPDGLETLATMKHVVFGGGPMNPAKGDKLSKIVRHLCGFIGSTEGGACHLVSPPDSSHWNEFNFIDVGQKMEQVDGGLFELVYPNTELTRKCQLYFHSYPQLSEYRTKDLFVPVLGKTGWWTYRGRTDSWVTMSNALKMDPTDIENIVGGHPDVRGVLVAGDRRYRLCLLVEMKDDAIPENDIEREEVLNKLWPSIEKANKGSSKFGRIPRELVYFAPRGQPFLRASKGTIQRRLTIEAHANGINKLYATAENGLLTQALPPLETLNRQSLANLLQYLYTDVLELEYEVGMDDDVFAAGIDSFGIMTISSRLKAAVRQHGVPEARLEVISLRNLYATSTIRSLSAMLAIALSEGVDTIAQHLEDNQSKKDTLAFIHKYKTKVEHLIKKQPAAGKDEPESGGASASGEPHEIVLLTGSTGSLGTYVLHTLLARRDIKQVICLNRGSDAKERQVRSLEYRKLPPLTKDLENNRRVLFLEADISNERLGLSCEDWALIARKATVIVHNAYPVNFLMNVWQFESHFVGLLNLMQLSLRSGASLMFVSSISTAMSATGRRQRIPEVVLDVATQADDLLPQGYAQSKYVCEQMLQAFAESLAVESVTPQSVVVLRVGQICGPRFGSGPWNKWEWFPSLVMSSRFLGAAPDSIGQEINWVPVDELAKIVSELVAYAHPLAGTRAGEDEWSVPFQVFNVVNPRMSSWKEILPALQAEDLDTIPTSQWVVRLEESVEKSLHSLDQNPGAKLIAFYKDALSGDGSAEPVYDVENLVRASPTAATLGSITESDVRRWMDTWI